MKYLRIKATAISASMLSCATVMAHPGHHGESGLLATVAHFLGEHGYLVFVLAAVGGVVAFRRSRPL